MRPPPQQFASLSQNFCRFQDFKTNIDNACRAGEEFSKVFYETFDKRRHVLNKLYLDTANVVWNGNVVKGPQEITKFHDNLPHSEHTLITLDCQPLPDEATQGQATVLVTTSGTVKFEGNNTMRFTQNFTLTNQGNVWKVASDCFRCQEED
ncbi:NTF2- export protein 2 [Branchiostoma belcheri]|nr:NTF2- export protein 2 [Branchiostoma belcheri]